MKSKDTPETRGTCRRGFRSDERSCESSVSLEGAIEPGREKNVCGKSLGRTRGAAKEV